MPRSLHECVMMMQEDQKYRDAQAQNPSIVLKLPFDLDFMQMAELATSWQMNLGRLVLASDCKLRMSA